VFGRGRSLQALRAADVDDDTVAEVCRFLCGACSCQVKELNPGFDLLLAVNWDERLFAPGEPIPTEPVPTDASDAAPQLLAIAPGRSSSPEISAADVASTSHSPENLESAADRSSRPQPDRHSTRYLLLLIPAVLLAVLGCSHVVRSAR
jgi:hypothetical protein